MPKAVALYMGRTGPILPFIILASMGGVYAFQHYNAEKYVTNFIDQTKTKIETVIQKTTPVPKQLDPPTVTSTGTFRTSVVPDRKDTKGTPKVVMSDTPKIATDGTYKAEDDSETDAEIESALLEDSSIGAEYPGVELTGISTKALEKKIYDILHLLVGKYPKGESLSSMFTETVVNLTLNKETDRNAIVDSMNRFMANFPARGVKLLSVGINGFRLEINTRRIFVHKNGEHLDAYGKTTVLLDKKLRITCISDDVQEGEPTTLSPGFTPISYTLKSTISNKTKKKSR